jgi:hypothetical protein
LSTSFEGYLRDTTGSYFAPCHYIGANALLSVVLFLLEPLAQKKDSEAKMKMESAIKVSQNGKKRNDEEKAEANNNTN